MREPYRPLIAVTGLESCHEIAKSMTEANYAYYDAQGITQEIVREPLPLGGGYGFRWAFYRNGVEIPNGINGI